MTSKECVEATIEGKTSEIIPVVLPYHHLLIERIVHELTGHTRAHRIYGTPEEKAQLFSLARSYFELDWLSLWGIITELQNLDKKLREENGSLFVEDTITGETSTLPIRKPEDMPITSRIINNPDE